MPEYFKTQLLDGTTRVADSLTLPSAADVRGHSERRVRRRRIAGVSATLSVALLVCGVAFAFAQQNDARASQPLGGAASHVPTRPAGAEASATEARSGAAGPVSVQLTPPAEYAAATANEVRLTIANAGAAGQVVVEFKSTQTRALYWVEPCDSSAGGGCNDTSYAENPLKVAHNPLSGVPGVSAFDLAPPAGTSSYTAWVDLPSGVTSYTVAVLDGAKVLGQTVSGPIARDFPTVAAAGPSTMTITRGGSAVPFQTDIVDSTSGSYIDMFSFTTFSCMAGQSTVTLPQGSYTLQWYDGGGWAAVGPVKELGQFSYELSPNQTRTTRFRLRLSSSLPANVTSCQVTQLITPSTAGSAPYYDVHAPNARTVVSFVVR